MKAIWWSNNFSQICLKRHLLLGSLFFPWRALEADFIQALSSEHRVNALIDHNPTSRKSEARKHQLLKDLFASCHLQWQRQRAILAGEQSQCLLPLLPMIVVLLPMVAPLLQMVELLLPAPLSLFEDESPASFTGPTANTPQQKEEFSLQKC